MNKQKNNKKIGILDWLIFFAVIVMFIMVYIPQSIWIEEDTFKKQRRQRMKIISQAADFYYELTGEYTIDHNELFSLVEASMDSLLADSLFIGKKNIYLNDKTYQVMLEPGFHTIIDTTFSVAENIKQEVTDTLYTIVMKNLEDGGSDTLLANSKNFNKYARDSLFVQILNIDYENRTENNSNYLRRKFHLDNSLIYCPISDSNLDKKFLLSIEKDKNNDPVFKIASPLSKNDRELRYGIFRYNPGKEEYILGGVKSWAEK